MLKSLLKPKSMKLIGAALGLAASFALVCYTVYAPERGKDPQVTAMETESARFFAVERDITALARDASSGAAQSIGLSAEYALVSLKDGGRYYVRIDSQRALVGELLKDKLAVPAPSLFALSDVQPPAPPLTRLYRNLKDPMWISLLGPMLILYMLFLMNPMRSGFFKAARKPNTRFKDVVGVEEAKDALQDIVAYLKNPRKFSELGAKPPKGIVLEGHSGSGKTLLARAVAGEAGVPFIALAGGDFSDMFLGVGVRRVKKLFAAARKQAPCV